MGMILVISVMYGSFKAHNNSVNVLFLYLINVHLKTTFNTCNIIGQIISA